MTPNNQSRANVEIRDLIENWAESVRNLDISGAVANHAEDMLMFDVPPPVQIRGIDDYRQTWPPFFDWLKTGGTFEIVWLDVTSGEDVAYATALLRCGQKMKGQLSISHFIESNIIRNSNNTVGHRPGDKAARTGQRRSR